MEQLPTCEILRTLLNARFRAYTAAGTVDLELIEVGELDRRRRPEHLPTPVSLIFRGPAHVILTQDGYVLEHPEMGRHRFFLTPVLSDGRAPEYQVILA